MLKCKNCELNDDELYNLYIVQNKSSKEISQEYGVNNKTLRDYLSRHNIRKTIGRGEWFPPINEFFDLYINQNKTIDELAKFYSVTRSCINHFICRRNIFKDRGAINKNREKTFIERYGVNSPMCIDEIKEKMQNTCIERYGTTSSLGNKDVRAKALNTIKEKYGVENVLFSPIIKKKIYETMYKNGSTPTSSQQIRIFNIIRQQFGEDAVVLNSIYDKYSLDIELNVFNLKIDIEYDGWYWHKNSEKDLERNKFLIDNGYKVLRIKSGTKLPTNEQLLNSIDLLCNSAETYTEIVLDDWKN